MAAVLFRLGRVLSRGMRYASRGRSPSCPVRQPGPRRSRPHTFGWCWDGIACEAVSLGRSTPGFSRSHQPYTQGLCAKTWSSEQCPRPTAHGPRKWPARESGPGRFPGPLRCDEEIGRQKSMSPPPPGAAGAFSFSGFSTITASVVRNRPAMEAAFCSAERVTFAGSMIPALNMLT